MTASQQAAMDRLVDALALVPHPEGGYYREIFRSPHCVVDARGRSRSALTVIYFLLAGTEVSRWHRLTSDETWHFATGSAAQIDALDDAGGHFANTLGPHGPWQATIPAGRSFAARVLDPNGYALFTCCVAPGFEFEDFELLEPAEFKRRLPQHGTLIDRYAGPA